MINTVTKEIRGDKNKKGKEKKRERERKERKKKKELFEVGSKIKIISEQ